MQNDNTCKKVSGDGSGMSDVDIMQDNTGKKARDDVIGMPDVGIMPDDSLGKKPSDGVGGILNDDIIALHVKYMGEALKQARKAYALGEVPIGCIIEHEGHIIGRGYNRRNTDKNTLAHAEITAIRKASKRIGDWRLEGCTLYVTLEPCQMCAGAIIQARIPQVVIGCMNPKAGCGGSILNILEMPEFNHQSIVIRGILENECSRMLKTFFGELRLRSKQEK